MEPIAGWRENVQLFTDVAIAVGTIAAALAAVWLGRRAIRDQQTRDQRATEHANRQVFAYFHRTNAVEGRPQGPPTVEIVNGSTESISRITVLPSLFDLNGDDVGWSWLEGDPHDQVFVPFLLSGERRFALGQPFSYLGSNRVFPMNELGDARVTISWTDSHGETFTREDFERPYASSPAMPGRAIAGMVQPTPWHRRLWNRILLRDG